MAAWPPNPAPPVIDFHTHSVAFLHVILFFTSPIGLGHASRDAAIAAHLDDDVLFVTGGPAAVLLERHGFEVIDAYRPPPFDTVGGRLRRRALWLARYYMYYRRCRSIAGRIIRERKSSLVVADEDFAALVAVASCARTTPRVLVTDVLESRCVGGPAGIIERRMNAAMQRIMRGCDAVVIPQGGSESPPSPMHSNMHVVQPIVRHISESRETLRRRFGMDGKTVLVTVGGTDAGRFLLDAMEKVAARLEGTVETVILPGPALGGGVLDDLHQRIMAADVVVSLAGRSTIHEAGAYGTPGIFIPIAGHFEQEDNAAMCGYVHNDMDGLDTLILEKLAQPRSPSSADGARQAASIAQSLIQGKMGGGL